MVVIYAVRTGVEFLADIGIEQNIVRNDRGLEPSFLNTAWTIQIIRGSVLTIILLLYSPFLSYIYDIDVWLFVAMAFSPLLISLHSTSIFVLVRNLDVKARTLFEFRSEFVGFVVTLALAVLIPSVWALVGGALISICARTALSYRLPHPAHRPILHRGYAKEILHFGGWMFVSSFLLYAGANMDRLALGDFAPLAMVGVYGLARTMADLPAHLGGRLSYQILMPLLIAGKRDGEPDAVVKFAAARRPLVFLCAIGVGSAIAWADWAVRLMFDSRYHDAQWMLAMLLVSAWFATLANLNEAVVLGISGAAHNAAAHLTRLILVAAGLPIGYHLYGIPGAISAVVISEIGRLVTLGVVQQKIKITFLRQDIMSTMAMIVVTAAWVLIRESVGLSVPWID